MVIFVPFFFLYVFVLFISSLYVVLLACLGVGLYGSGGSACSSRSGGGDVSSSCSRLYMLLGFIVVDILVVLLFALVVVFGVWVWI